MLPDGGPALVRDLLMRSPLKGSLHVRLEFGIL